MPPQFEAEYGPLPPRWAFLSSYLVRDFPVAVSWSENGLFQIDNGWDEFLMLHHLGIGSAMMFFHKGNVSFQVCPRREIGDEHEATLDSISSSCSSN